MIRITLRLDTGKLIDNEFESQDEYDLEKDEDVNGILLETNTSYDYAQLYLCTYIGDTNSIMKIASFIKRANRWCLD